ncbi:MAG: hypothetical protein DWQ08_07730 [Proteobacteria bacterium]|nr:MAG: hypothetical protein DWQ08_07730 [Pseudomonadota bacterium]
MVAKALESDQKRSVRDWVELASTCYDLVLEPYRAGSVLIKPGARLLTPIPGLPDEGLSATFTRNIALENEDLQFLTWEHPVVEALGDLVLNTERGNATICAIRHRELPRGRVAVECVFVVEAPLFSRPELACYVPPLLVCEIHDETGQRLDPRLDHDAVSAGWVPLKYKASRQVIEIKRQALQGILERAGDSLEQRAGRMLLQHGRPGLETLKEELARLRYLSTVNPNVRPEEIRHHEAMIESVAESIRHPRIRLDAVRVIVGL